MPQTEGTPNIPANLPPRTAPADEYVDWVGTDFYSRFPAFAKLERFYAQYPRKPFVFGEWAMWGADDPGFVTQFFGWVNAHKRVQMLVYNQGANPNGPFRLNAIRRHGQSSSRLAQSAFLATWRSAPSSSRGTWQASSPLLAAAGDPASSSRYALGSPAGPSSTIGPSMRRANFRLQRH